MKQEVMTAPGKVEFRDIPIPELHKNEVLVRIMRIGVCGSDLHVYHGKHPYTDYPVTQGHEVSGKIEKIGSNVKNLKSGDKVTIQPQVVCDKCYPCTHGKYHICDDLKVMGFQTTGAGSEFFAVDSEKIIKLPDDISYEQGAMIEPLAVAVHAVSRGGDITGFNVLVLGAGPIGNLVGQTAKALGAKAVLISDLSDFRLRIDARKGSDIILVGVFGAKPCVDLGFVQDRELRLIGTLMYQTADYIKSIELVGSSKIKLEPLMTTHFPFEDYGKAYKFIDDKKDKVMKVFIDVNKE
ncbi:MAG: zinc-dependent alcohol dehydrogenase [Promethearchaeota archaeon]|jgi:L-iditol 2-dehydrogenase